MCFNVGFQAKDSVASLKGCHNDHVVNPPENWIRVFFSVRYYSRTWSGCRQAQTERLRARLFRLLSSRGYSRVLLTSCVLCPRSILLCSSSFIFCPSSILLRPCDFVLRSLDLLSSCIFRIQGTSSVSSSSHSGGFCSFGCPCSYSCPGCISCACDISSVSDPCCFCGLLLKLPLLLLEKTLRTPNGIKSINVSKLANILYDRLAK